MEIPQPFVPYGVPHLTTLALFAVVPALLVWLVRARPSAGGPVRWSLALALAALVAFELVVGAREGWLTWRFLLPLELCDAALVLALFTLARPRPAPAELLYFWAGSGSLLAMVTPELPWDFPRWEFVVFFGLHGLVLTSALVLVFGLGLRPRRGAPWRAFLITAAWTAFVGLVDLVMGANYMYLRHKPLAPTLLDVMGPWPVYIAAGAGVALVLFQLLSLPFRREWRAPAGEA